MNLDFAFESKLFFSKTCVITYFIPLVQLLSLFQNLFSMLVFFPRHLTWIKVVWCIIRKISFGKIQKAFSMILRNRCSSLKGYLRFLGLLTLSDRLNGTKSNTCIIYIRDLTLKSYLQNGGQIFNLFFYIMVCCKSHFIHKLYACQRHVQKVFGYNIYYNKQY